MMTLSGDMTPSKTYAVRAWLFLAGVRNGAGVLTVTQARSAKPGAALEVETYDVEEDPTQWHPVRAFVLGKRSDGEVYEVTLGPEDRCTCDAARAKLACKHVAAVRAVMNAGGFDGGHDAAAVEAAFDKADAGVARCAG